METGRLILDPPARGSWNMAVDQALLESTDKSGRATVRLYRWADPTLSLGYFQPHRQRESHHESQTCHWLRRSTGGGAILHHHEITYSICVPKSMRWFKHNIELYDLVHQATLKTLALWNIDAELFDSKKHENTGKTDAFLCFERRTDGDIVLGDAKIGGSAQRRSKQTLLQHGSLIFSKSTFAPQLPGIADLSSNQLCLQVIEKDFVKNWCHNVQNRLKLSLDTEVINPHEVESAISIENARFSAAIWNEKR